MTRGVSAETEAEQHWRDSVMQINEAIDHAMQTEVLGKTLHVRQSAARAIQRFNRELSSLMDHHPVLCACPTDGTRQGCNELPDLLTA